MKTNSKGGGFLTQSTQRGQRTQMKSFFFFRTIHASLCGLLGLCDLCVKCLSVPITPVTAVLVSLAIVPNAHAADAAKPKPSGKLSSSTKAAAPHDEIARYYHVETIPAPADVIPEIGGVSALPDGRLAVCFERGEVYFYNPVTKEWKFFAEGLHDPLGIVAISDREVIIAQRPELTRLKDTDGDGVADRFEPVTDAFGLSGNYHEFHFGPVRDAEGNLFISLNTASKGAGIRPEIRGEYRETGRQGRMYSCVPYRGWIIKLTPDGQFIPWACGFRSPNGMGFDAQGRLFVSDNQGDWLGSSKLFHVEKDHFYGHPASLVWKPGFKGEPLKLSVAELDKMRTKESIMFSHGIMANSPTQSVCDMSGGKFGPFAGQMFIGEMNVPRIIRLMLEDVGGELQGASVPFYDRAGLQSGDNRLAFTPDGSLWIGQTRRDKAWAGAKGLQHITWTGQVPPEVKAMNLTKQGFDLTFTRPLDADVAGKAESYTFKRYSYEYHAAYGSPQMDVGEVKVTDVKVSDDRLHVSLTLAELKAGYQYEMRLKGLTAEGGDMVVNTMVIYTLNRLK